MFFMKMICPLDMVNKEIVPAVMRYSREVADAALAKRSFIPDLSMPQEEKLVRRLTCLLSGIGERAETLKDSIASLEKAETPLAKARHCRDSIFAAMENGETRRENLQTFYKLASDFESTSRRELSQFLEYLDMMKTLAAK